MAKKGRPLSVASKAIDPTLDALFSASAGPVSAPSKSRYSGLSEKKTKSEAATKKSADADEDDDEVLSEISEELDYGDEEGDEEIASNSGSADQEGDAASEQSAGGVDLEAAVEATEGSSKSRRDRKRKRKEDNEDLEGKYLAELTKNDDPEPTGKRIKGEKEAAQEEESDEDFEVPVHEALTKDAKVSEMEKAARTVFLANVASEAITSKSAKKTLMTHLSTVLDKEASPPQELESIRFRSVAFSTNSMPKRAAYITGALMDSTTKSTNAYAVFSTSAAARKASAELNGSEVLGRHIRVDSVAHPSPTDHRRCVFVGNLGFVDDETVLNQGGDGVVTEKKRNKVPSDIEEGLWRTFGTKGRVENVRVVRDPKTRVGKGFAYVQFYDANDVEGALLLNEKKFPPMLPRALRVTRAKDPRKTALAQERSKSKSDNAYGPPRDMKYRPKITAESQAAAGRAGKLLGRAGAAMQRKASKGGPGGGGGHSMPRVFGDKKSPEQIVYEGRRASSTDGRPKDLKFGKKPKGKTGRPKGRGARRASEWKRGG